MRINKPNLKMTLMGVVGISWFLFCGSAVAASKTEKMVTCHRNGHRLCKQHHHKKSNQSDFNQQFALLKQSGAALLASEQTKVEAPSHSVVVGRGLPSVSIASPNAFGSGNSIFAAGGYSSHQNGTTVPEGSFSAGGSVGDAHKYVDVTVSWVAADSFGGNDSFNKNGGLSLRVNRYLAKNTAIAAGVGNPVGWGSLNAMSSSYYVALTQGLDTYFPITLNIGAGTGAFYSTASMQSNRNDQIRAFGGVGVTVLKGLSLIVDDATDQLNAGATYIFTIKKVSCFLTAAGMNVAKQGGFQPHFEGMAGLSYAL